jgi:hypothetical protein
MNAKQNTTITALILGALLGAFTSSTALAQSQSLNYNNSPLNYSNSPLNYNNSPLNYNNSPLNYENSPLNYNATNGVYDSQGNRTGYTTVSPEGVTNIYSQDGSRRGYIPAPEAGGGTELWLK